MSRTPFRLSEGAKENGFEVKKHDETIREFNETTTLRREENVENARQFNETMAQRRQEHADTLKIDLRDFNEAVRQYDLGRTDRIAEIAGRLKLDTAQLQAQIDQYAQSRLDQIDQFAETMGLNKERLREEVRQFNKSTALEYDRLATQFDLAKLAQEQKIDIMKLDDMFQQEAEDRAYLRQLTLVGIEGTEADKDRAWRSIEAELNRVFQATMQDDTQTFEQREARRQRYNDNLGIAYEGLAEFGGLLVVTKLFGNKAGMTSAQFTAAILQGRGSDPALYKQAFPELTDSEVQAYADNYASKSTGGTTDTGGTDTGGTDTGGTDTGGTDTGTGIESPTEIGSQVLPRVNRGRITGFDVTPEGTRRYTKFTTPDGVTHDIDGIEEGVPSRVSSSGAKEYYNASADAPGRVGSWQNQRPEATVDLEKEWKDATRNLRAMSARDWTNATMSMANWFVTGASWDQMMRTNPILGQLSALMMAKSGALAASIGPAFMVGYTAYMAYQAFRDEPSPGALGYFTAGIASKRRC